MDCDRDSAPSCCDPLPQFRLTPSQATAPKVVAAMVTPQQSLRTENYKVKAAIHMIPVHIMLNIQVDAMFKITSTKVLYLKLTIDSLNQEPK